MRLGRSSYICNPSLTDRPEEPAQYNPFVNFSILLTNEPQRGRLMGSPEQCTGAPAPSFPSGALTWSLR